MTSTERPAWYIVGTLRPGDTLETKKTMVAIHGPWTRSQCEQKLEFLRAKNPKRIFRMLHETDNDLVSFRERDIISKLAQARKKATKRP